MLKISELENFVKISFIHNKPKKRTHFSTKKFIGKGI